MTNPKHVQTLEIHRNRVPVATLTKVPKGCVFRYTDEFLNSTQEAIARHLPKVRDGIETHGLANLPTYFAGLLPEGIMQDAIVRHQRLSRDDLFSQLVLTGYDAIGDIAHIPGEPHPNRPSQVKDLAQAIRQMAYEDQFHPMSAITGAQPKMSIGHAIASQRTGHRIVKIPPREYPGILPNEEYFMKLAPKAGLPTARVTLDGENLVIHRFDRQADSRQIHIEDTLQILDLYPNAKYSLDYLEIMDAAQSLEVGNATMLALLRLYAYSYCIGNGDLHAKNVSFQYGNGWRMTPAYDLLCTLPFFEHSKMALGLDDDFGNFTPEDFIRVAERYRIPEKSIRLMLQAVGIVVVREIAQTPPPIPPAAMSEILRRSKSFAGA